MHRSIGYLRPMVIHNGHISRIVSEINGDFGRNSQFFTRTHPVHLMPTLRGTEGVPLVQKVWRYVHSFRHDTTTWRTDRQTDTNRNGKTISRSACYILLTRDIMKVNHCKQISRPHLPRSNNMSIRNGITDFAPSPRPAPRVSGSMVYPVESFLAFVHGHLAKCSCWYVTLAYILGSQKFGDTDVPFPKVAGPRLSVKHAPFLQIWSFEVIRG